MTNLNFEMKQHNTTGMTNLYIQVVSWRI